MGKIYYTYVLKSDKDKNLYVGHTGGLRKRLIEHNKGFVDSTKSRRPLKLIYFEACLSEIKSIKREIYFKTGFGRRFLKNRI